MTVGDGFVEHDGGIWVPNEATARVEKEGSVVLDNRTDLPDNEIIDYFVENAAAFGWGSDTRYLSYQGEGSALARSRWKPPSNVIEEIKLARDLMEKDDDVAATKDMMLAAAFSEGFQNQHTDAEIEHVFDEMTEDVGFYNVLQELYREWLISQQLNTVTLFTRANYDIRPEGVSRVLNRSVAVPFIGILPAENVRVVGSNIFGAGDLAYEAEQDLDEWLGTYHNPNTSAAKKREMRNEDPIAAALFTGPVEVDWNDRDLFTTGMRLWALNPLLVQRSTAAKGAWKYPRPLLTRNFPLLEAKRLLNVMDFALLQGGTNYIVVAKKGTDQKPALQPEIDNLREVVKRASKSGVLIGDHRISLEVVTPDLGELLNPAKRMMLGRKLSGALLRLPELASDDKGQAMTTLADLIARVISMDRLGIREHVHRHQWKAMMKRNASTFGRAAHPNLWFPKIILTGQQFFNDYLLKMYDRGDLSRKAMLEFGGFNYDAIKAQKQREVEAGHDEIFTPPAVPFSSPENAPNDGPGRPRGSGPNNGAPGARPSPNQNPAPRRLAPRRRGGEPVRAYYDDDQGQVVRIGELTDSIFSEFEEGMELGRLTSIEQRAIEARETTQEGAVVIVPVNPGYEIRDVRAVRLAEGLSLLVGNRVPDGAIVARAVCFREPQYTLSEAEDRVIRWGFEIDVTQQEAREEEEPENGHVNGDRESIFIHVHTAGGEVKKMRHRIERDENGQAIGSIVEPVEEEE